MTFQRLLLRLLRWGLLPQSGVRYLQRRIWTVETGTCQGLKLTLPQNAEYVLGTNEVPVQHALHAALGPNAVFYDIGANVGFFSLLAAKAVGPMGAVYAFEPISENVQVLRRNAKLNRFDALSVFEIAVGEKCGTSELFLSEWNGGASLSVAAHRRARKVPSRNVKVMSLDEIIRAFGLRPPTLVKIDVEGAEAPVIRGMSQTLSAYRPTVLFEVDDPDPVSFARRWNALDELVESFGYNLTRLEKSYPDLNWSVGHSIAVPSS